MFPFLRLGPFLIQMLALALLAGVWSGLSLVEKEARRLKLNPNKTYNMVFYGLVAGLIGARLGYAALYFNVYLASPLSLFALTLNTLSPDAGVVAGVAVAVLFGWREKLSLRPTLDALAPGLAAFMIAFGLAHLFSGDDFGAPAKLPWAIYLWGDYRHPSQVYEIVAALAVFIVIYKRPLGEPGSGLNFLATIALSAAARIFLEAFRGDSVLWAGGFRAAQIISLIVLAGSLWLAKTWTQNFETGKLERSSPGAP